MAVTLSWVGFGSFFPKKFFWTLDLIMRMLQKVCPLGHRNFCIFATLIFLLWPFLKAQHTVASAQWLFNKTCYLTLRAQDHMIFQERSLFLPPTINYMGHILLDVPTTLKYGPKVFGERFLSFLVVYCFSLSSLF